MGHGPLTRTTPTEELDPYKVFEYNCPRCNSHRTVQYFFKNGVFLQQTPRVVCGKCYFSVTVEPYKTVGYECPSCGLMQKARLPGKPIPLDMYSSSTVACSCGFKGKVSVGRLMQVTCCHCWTQRQELLDVWAEDGEETKTRCETCHETKVSFVVAPKIKDEPDLEYTCENCFRSQKIPYEDLLRSGGIACCSLCGWIGCPEEFTKGGPPRDELSDTDSQGASSPGAASPPT